jgi:hypothetical protein
VRRARGQPSEASLPHAAAVKADAATAMPGDPAHPADQPVAPVGG